MLFMEVYVLDLAPLSARLDEALARLSPERRAKSARVRIHAARVRSVGAGLLLGRFFPGREVRVSARGKPYVPGGREFSLSHSGALAVIALGDGARVGVDAERDRAVSEALRRRVLSPEEHTLGAEAFFLLWTRKEAALKCLGAGVDRSLAGLDVRADTLSLDGRTLFLHTARWGEYTLSAAAEGASAAFTPRALTIDQLLSEADI